MKTCVVIYNPNSGHTLEKTKLPKYKKIIEKYGYTPTFIGTQYRGHAKEIVSHLGYVDLVISMGGDGTFNEVVYGNIQRKRRLILAHIPVGTTNDVGTMFGYGKNIEDNLRLCLTGEVRDIDIPMVNNRPFVYVCGFGKFMQIPYETPREEKKKYGHLAYVWNGIKDFFTVTKSYNISFEVDGVEKTGKYSLMLIGSATRIAGMDNFFRDVKLNDDKFEILLCTYTKRLDILRAFAQVLAVGAEHVGGFEYYKASKMEIIFDKHPKKAWCVDGEQLEIRTLKYSIKNEKSIKILLPKKNLKKLFIDENK